MAWFDSLTVLPYSTLFIFLVNVVVVLLGALIFRLLIDIDRLETQEAEIQSYEKNLKAAKSRNDKAALRKLKREEIRIKTFTASTSKQRLKVVLITILPFTVVSLLLISVYSGKEIVNFPFEFGFFNKDYAYTIWYFLTYFTAYLPLSRIFRSAPSFRPSSLGKPN
ncbi:MAG: EMC3/TMCO1 family protein [Candidatus Bathyarchaeota archaeon]